MIATIVQEDTAALSSNIQGTSRSRSDSMVSVSEKCRERNGNNCNAQTLLPPDDVVESRIISSIVDVIRCFFFDTSSGLRGCDNFTDRSSDNSNKFAIAHIRVQLCSNLGLSMRGCIGSLSSCTVICGQKIRSSICSISFSDRLVYSESRVSRRPFIRRPNDSDGSFRVASVKMITQSIVVTSNSSFKAGSLVVHICLMVGTISIRNARENSDRSNKIFMVIVLMQLNAAWCSFPAIVDDSTNSASPRRIRSAEA